jgi:hypothetical protein
MRDHEYIWHNNKAASRLAPKGERTPQEYKPPSSADGRGLFRCRVQTDRSGGRGCRKLGLRLRLRRIRLQVGKLKLKLLQDVAAFRGLSELLVAQLGDRELQLLDQQRM